MSQQPTHAGRCIHRGSVTRTSCVLPIAAVRESLFRRQIPNVPCRGYVGICMSRLTMSAILSRPHLLVVVSGDRRIRPGMAVHANLAIAVQIVEKNPLVSNSVMIRRNFFTEYRKPGVPVTFRNVTKELIVGAILFDHIDHMLDWRARPYLLWNDARLLRRAGHCQVVVFIRDILVYLLGPVLDLTLQF